ncbi:hypothetical protein BDN70DRAFT_875191 [Pholiota conissans]|uniref:F-box domain-containing protein n=1 Tax=Pholiota conissans TaxID=109636 RepID=A0A9P5Z7I7_9AGAR|nr:hypothetical protein BDN70DRAFT_875191 [Pholiota conissans]
MPADTLPYDVLREIFTYCLPRYPFKDVYQPDVKSAPILLCHVCSSWRTGALASATLWSHLSYELMVYPNTPKFNAWSLLENQVEFISWWKTNHGSIAPFLTIAVRIVNVSPSPDRLLDWDSVEFLLPYLISAQYLYIDRFLWDRIRDRIEDEGQISFPNLHTVVEDSRWTDDPFFYAQILPNKSLPKLRHVDISHIMLEPDPIQIHPNGNRLPCPSNWSTLTHISLRRVGLDPDLWLSILHAAPNLQWGYFAINENRTRRFTHTKLTHSQLTSLFIDAEDQIEDLFRDIHLPVLQSLHLFSFTEAWGDERAIRNVSTATRSAPKITTLTLRDGFLAFGEVTEPLWKYSPNLTHLQLDAPYSYSSADLFVQNFLSKNNKWLDLANPACSICKITLISIAFQDNTKEYAMAPLRDLAKEFPKIEFDFASESPFYEAENEWKKWNVLF